ncbi:MAG: WbqC family protein, partial [Eubacterium sp.]
MKLEIMQPYFFPYIGYWQLIHCVDQYVIYDDVNFIKNGWINRNRILLNGEPHMINLPMEGASSNKLINEINVSTNQTVRLKTVKCIENAYRKAPYFNKCMQLVEEIMNDKTNNLAS